MPEIYKPVLYHTSNICFSGCDLYDYDKTWFETTVPSENNWVCENELFVPNILAYSRIGEIVGSLFFGWFGDVYVTCGFSTYYFFISKYCVY